MEYSLPSQQGERCRRRAVELDQVEGIEEHIGVMVSVADAVETRNPVFTACHHLAVDDAGPRAKLGQRIHNEREAIGQVIAGTAIEPHPLAVLAGDYPEPIMLDFVQPLAA
jgi:hypothetical protein